MAVFAAIIHAAANEMDAGRLDAAKASTTITGTMLATLEYQRSSGREVTTSGFSSGHLSTQMIAGGPMNSGAQRGATLWGGSCATLGVALRFLGVFALPIRGEAAGLMHVQHRDDK